MTLRGRVLAALARVKQRRRLGTSSTSTVPSVFGESATISHDPEHDYAEYFCPRCEPDRDQTQGMSTVRWCGLHQPTTDGAVTISAEYLSPMGQMEAGGEDNVRMCGLIHRGEST